MKKSRKITHRVLILVLVGCVAARAILLANTEILDRRVDQRASQLEQQQREFRQTSAWTGFQILSQLSEKNLLTTSSQSDLLSAQIALNTDLRNFEARRIPDLRLDTIQFDADQVSVAGSVPEFSQLYRSIAPGDTRGLLARFAEIPGRQNLKIQNYRQDNDGQIQFVLTAQLSDD